MNPLNIILPVFTEFRPARINFPRCVLAILITELSMY